MSDAVLGGGKAKAQAISRAFVAARRRAAPLTGFPGALPATLAEAYAVQRLSVAAWPDAVAGWKVGAVPEAFRDGVSDARLAGPIFADSIRVTSGGAPVRMGVYAGGFAAVEAEVVVRMRESAPSGGARLGEADIAALIDVMHVGVEIASSPLGAINELGPMSIVSDFGNNAGLVVGPEIEGWRDLPPSDIVARVLIGGAQVGEAPASGIPGGPLSAVAFLIESARRRGAPLKAGEWVSTGAITGVHEVASGARARADFGPLGAIDLEIEAIEPLE